MKKKLLNDGLVQICTVGNIAAPGDTPKDGISVRQKLRFAWKTVGFQRYFDAMQAQVWIDKIILVLLGAGITPQDIAVIGGEQYKIVQVQLITGEKPEKVQLSLQRLEADYDIATVP